MMDGCGGQHYGMSLREECDARENRTFNSKIKMGNMQVQCHESKTLFAFMYQSEPFLEKKQYENKQRNRNSNSGFDTYSHPANQEEDEDDAFQKQTALKKMCAVVVMKDFNYHDICWDTLQIMSFQVMFDLSC